MAWFKRDEGTLLEQAPLLSHGDGDHERFSHYVRKEKILESALSGDPVKALCGKVWVPTRDPEKFPICPTCKEIHANMKPGRDE
ncbi:MAG: DUF3039 domain-containing protein [Actinobacteria bacterium]|jgi:hypothetical protein|nr:DUF3039 domain-containing protein [Actinomycetota bacterium]NBP91401.1 DUF3039 domain-containing protein [Actinomycetota bacterium]